MYKKLTLVLILLSSSLPSYSKGFEPILGVYLDSFTGVAGKIGFRYNFEEDKSENEEHEIKISNNWGQIQLFSDLEIGTDASKITLGIAQESYFSTRRLGIVVAEKNKEEHIGAEYLSSSMGMSYKFGALQNIETSNQLIFIGFGLGF